MRRPICGLARAEFPETWLPATCDRHGAIRNTDLEDEEEEGLAISIRLQKWRSAHVRHFKNQKLRQCKTPNTEKRKIKATFPFTSHLGAISQKSTQMKARLLKGCGQRPLLLSFPARRQERGPIGICLWPWRCLSAFPSLKLASKSGKPLR